MAEEVRLLRCAAVIDSEEQCVCGRDGGLLISSCWRRISADLALISDLNQLATDISPNEAVFLMRADFSN